MVQKYNIFSRHNISQIIQILYFFILVHIEDLDDVQIYNYLYLFKYFFGKIAILTKIKTFFNLGKWTYSLRVYLNFSYKQILYNQFLFFINDLYLNSDKNFYSIYSLQRQIYYFVLTDLAIFTNKKTNLGLFYLKQKLNVHIICTGCTRLSLASFFKNLKLKYEIKTFWLNI